MSDKKSKKERILTVMENSPLLSDREIAEVVGCRREYVWTLRQYFRNRPIDKSFSKEIESE